MLIINLLLLYSLISVMPQLGPVWESFTISIGSALTINIMGIIRGILGIIVVIKVFNLMIARSSLIEKDRWFLFIFIYAILSMVWVAGEARGEGLRLILQYSLTYGLFYLTMYQTSEEEKMITLIKFLLIIALILSISSLILGTVDTDIRSGGHVELDRGERLIGLTSSPNLLAGFLTVFIVLAICIIIVPETPRHLRRLSWAVLGITPVALLFTYSRSGWIGAELGLLSALILNKHWKKLFLIIGLSLILLLATGIGNKFMGNWQDALSADLDQTASIRGYQNLFGRTLLWINGVDELVSTRSALMGRGAGTAQNWAFSISDGGMHSEFLQNFIDFGLIGLAFILLGFWIIIRHGYWLFSRARSPLSRAIGLSGICIIIAMLPKFLWDHLFNGPCGWLLLLACGLVIGAECWEDSSAANEIDQVGLDYSTS